MAGIHMMIRNDLLLDIFFAFHFYLLRFSFYPSFFFRSVNDYNCVELFSDENRRYYTTIMIKDESSKGNTQSINVFQTIIIVDTTEYL